MTESIRSFYLARRHPALSPDEFPIRWRAHGELAASLNRSGRAGAVRQCRTLREDELGTGTLPGYEPPDDDGVAVIAQPSREAVVEMWQDPIAIEVLQPDELRTFAGYVRHVTVHGVATVIRDAPDTDVALLEFLRFRRAGPRPDFGPDLIRSYRAGVDALPSGRVAITTVFDRAAGLDLDVVSEMWFESLDELASWWVARWPALNASRDAWCDRRLSLVTAVNYRRG